MGNSHAIQVVINGAVIGGWTGYRVDSSMITPADGFELRRPFSLEAWSLLRRDSDVTIELGSRSEDGRVSGWTPILRGFVDKRVRQAKAGTMTISGRDRCGRLVDESAPAISFNGLTVEQAFKKLISPWFSTLTLSDARNRRLRRGKGRRVASGAEDPVTINIRVPRQGNVHPGEKRGHVMHEIASRAQLIWWSSADGKEIFIGKPNQTQAPQYVFTHAKSGSATQATVKDLTITEDDGDRYSLIMVSGTGGQGDTNYGTIVTDNRGVSFDNPFNRLDGTGRDFIHPKRLTMPEKSFASFHDAQRVADIERIRRDYKRHIVSVEAPLHGQFLTSGGPPTLFAYNTVARVIDEELELDDTYLIVSCAFSSNREQGETTTMHMVPTGTEILL
jgi:prophage tail gpP-like protein